MREIAMLRSIQHPNVVTLIDVFRYKHKLCLVFDYVESTVLQLIEKSPSGLSESTVQRLVWQLLQAIECLHSHGIMHRDIKPENLLVSSKGILKICDFGFARKLSEESTAGGKYSEYVATRWYRAPELLQSKNYDASVDIWAIGCLTIEMLTARPMMPGTTDIDQLSLIAHCIGPIPGLVALTGTDDCNGHVDDDDDTHGDTRLIHFKNKYQQLSSNALSFVESCLQIDPNNRPTALQLMKHRWLTNNTAEWKTPAFLTYLDQARQDLDEQLQLVLQRRSFNGDGAGFTHVLHNNNTQASAHATAAAAAAISSSSLTAATPPRSRLPTTRLHTAYHVPSSLDAFIIPTSMHDADVRRDSLHSINNAIFSHTHGHASTRHATTSYGTTPTTIKVHDEVDRSVSQNSPVHSQKKVSSPYLSKPSSIASKSSMNGKRSMQSRSRSSSPTVLSRTTPGKNIKPLVTTSTHTTAKTSSTLQPVFNQQTRSSTTLPDDDHLLQTAMDCTGRKIANDHGNEPNAAQKGRFLLRRVLPHRAHRD